MLGATVPQILYEQWFWFAILAVILVLLYFARKKYPPSFPRIRASLVKRGKGIARTTDFLIVASLILFGGLLLSFPVRNMVEALSTDSQTRAVEFQFACLFCLVPMVIWSGQAAFVISLLSPFHSNLTKQKRIILLLLCLLPAAFTGLTLATESADGRWSTIQLGVFACFPSWIVNAPPILAGLHFVDFVRRVLCKLRLVSSNSSP